MGTYDDSKIRTARKDYACTDPRHAIRRGDRYLDYKLGQRWHVQVCLECAAKLPRYRCRATEEFKGRNK